MVDYLQVAGGEEVGNGGIVDVGEEVGVFEVEKNEEVEYHASGHLQAATWGGECMIHTDAEQPTEEGGEDEQEDEESRCFIIEKQTGEEEIAVAQGLPSVLLATAGEADDESEADVDEEEE